MVDNIKKEQLEVYRAIGRIPAIQSHLNTLCERLDDIAEATIALTDNNEHSLGIIAQWPHEHELSSAMKNTLDAAVQRASSVKIVPAISAHDSNQACIIAMPLISDKKTLGVIALSLTTSDNKTTTTRLIELEQLVTSFTALVTSDNGIARPADANKLLQLQTIFLAQDSLKDASAAFVNELTNILKFNRVSIGLLKNQIIDLIAISNYAEFQHHQHFVPAISAAMEEAVDQAESIAFPALIDDKPRVHLAHQALVKKTGNATCSIPLIHNQEVIGSICLEHHTKSNMTREAIIWYEHIANFIAPLLILKQEAELAWYKRATASFKTYWQNLFSQDNHTSKFIIGALTLFLIGLLFPVSYHVGARAHIEGATQRILAAPVEGFIKQAYVRPGDMVKKDQLLIELADQELILEKEKWESEIVQQENDFSAALARQDRTQYAISQAKATQARAELSLIKQKLERSHIVSPINGIVLEGDLSQSLGAPVALGDRLMTIAPKDQYRLIIDIDERDISNIAIGKKGVLALSAIPTEKIAFTVERITPMASVKDGRNTYEVEANILNKNIYLRPGLQGVAKIEAGKRSTIWSLSHRIVNWLQLTFWKWGA